MTRTSDSGGANPTASLDSWVVPHDRAITIGAKGSNAEIALPVSGSDTFASARWTGDLLELRALSEHSRPIVDGKPVLFKRVAVGKSFTIADHTFNVSGPAQLSMSRVHAPKPASPKVAGRTGRKDAHTGKSWRLATGKLTTIGREGGSAEIQVSGLELAQRHATVSWTGHHIELRAVAPQVRPFVNGEAVLHARLPVGGQFVIGHHTFVVSNPAEISLVVATPAITRETALRVSNVSLQYRGEPEPQLKAVSFELARGEVLAVIGPSGAGKSTMCGGLLGEVRLAGGSMILAGVDLTQSRTQASHLISFVPQQPAMFDDLTVRESLSHVAKMRLSSDTKAEERAARVDEVIAAMALTADADKAIKDLSGGQRKRTSTAMELLSDPVLLILDEPTSGLDEGLDRAMMETLKQAASKGIAVIIITHSMVNLDKADKVLALTGEGRPAFLGPPNELLTAFDVTSFAAAMDALRAGKRVPLPAVSAPRAQLAADTITPSPPLRGSTRNHVVGLIRRELSRLRNARKRIGWLLVSGILGTSLLTCAASPDGLGGDPTAISSTLLPFIVCVTFFSMMPSFTTIVDDREVIEREARWSVSALSLITSRAITCALQAIPLSVLATSAYLLLPWSTHPVDPLLAHPAGLLLFAILLAAAAMSVGLLVSVVSRSLHAAVNVLLAVLALQVVLTGLAPQFKGGAAPLMKAIALPMPSRWASAGLGADYGLTTSRPARADAAGGEPSIPSPFTDAIWTHDTSHIWMAAIALVLIAIASLTFATYVLKRQLLSTK